MNCIKQTYCLAALLVLAVAATAQKPNMAQLKLDIEKSANSPLYVKQVLKKKFKLDTVVVTRTRFFSSLADSLAYHGQEKKVYGPFKQNGQSFLVQILAKSPNQFYRLSQLFIDTAIVQAHFADSLADVIMRKIKEGSASFEELCQTYTMGGESATKGDLGWVARGVLYPPIERELVKRKKGEVFKVWSANGLHIIKKTENAKQDTGFALMMRIFL